MNAESEQPLIDSLLEETLAGVQPPDLSARILAAWSSGQFDASRPALPLSALETLPEPSAPPVAVRPTSLSDGIRPVRRARSHSWNTRSWSTAASLLASAAAVLLLVWLGLTFGGGERPIAKPIDATGESPRIAE